VYPYAVVVNKSKLNTATESSKKSTLETAVDETVGLCSDAVISTFRSGVIVVGEVILVFNKILKFISLSYDTSISSSRQGSEAQVAEGYVRPVPEMYWKE
jgi:hypothetical protein